MKKAGKHTPKVSPCAERNRLWETFLAASNEWNLQQDKMAKDIRSDGKIHVDVKKVQAIQKRIEGSHRLFAEHIEKHGCGPMMRDPTRLEEKSTGKRK